MGLTDGAAAAGQAAAAGVLPVVVVQAALAVGAVRVVAAVPAVATVAGGAVQLGVVVTLGTLPVAVAGCGAKRRQPEVSIAPTYGSHADRSAVGGETHADTRWRCLPSLVSTAGR